MSDWDEKEALRESLREHMAEIHRLRAAGRQALSVMERINHTNYSWACVDVIPVIRAALEPVTDCHDLQHTQAATILNLLAHFGITSANSDVNAAYLHKQLDDFLTSAMTCEKGGGKLPPPLESEYLSEKSLNEFVEQLKAADRNNRISIKPTHMVFRGDTLADLKKLADERNADAGETSDHIVDANKKVATVRKSRMVGPAINETRHHKANRMLKEAMDSDRENIIRNMPDFDFDFSTESQKRKPLTDEEIAVTAAACNSLESEFLVDFARAIEKAHDIGGEE